ncbi:uncharacterized protein [Chelonus insularis]|uniref:uncharacterized protein n=1 Tax=Chelonus insularis TaxID=460826 RepID=UPI00158D383C|nr:uncharacterized protein LOC118068467 [Chelonus insularis]
MAKQNYNYEKNRNYLEDMSQLIAEIERLKPEPEECNISCPPFGCPLGPCPGMCCNSNSCNPCCVSKKPSVSQQHVQLSSFPHKLEFSKNFNYPSTSTSPDACLVRNLPCDAVELTQICYPPVVPRPNWETSAIEILENPDYTPRSNYYYQRKPFRSHCPPNGPQN